MKASIRTDVQGHVILSYDHEAPDGEVSRIERTFHVPTPSGYVREYLRNGEMTQVCEKLVHRGPTLSCSRERLAEVIRKEYRAMRREEKRENQ